MELPTDRAIAKNSGEKYVRIGMPQNPFRIEWSLMSSDGELNNVDALIWNSIL